MVIFRRHLHRSTHAHLFDRVATSINASTVTSTRKSHTSELLPSPPYVTSNTSGISVRTRASDAGAASTPGRASFITTTGITTLFAGTTGNRPNPVDKPPPATSPPPSMTSSNMPPSTSATAYNITIYHNNLLAFVRSGPNWISNLAKPGVISKALEDLEKLLRSTESHIEHLGGSIPSQLSRCSTSSKHKRSLGLLAIVQDLAGDALDLVRCVKAISEDLSNEIRQLIKEPPSSEMVKLIEEQLDALTQALEEQEDGHSSTADKASSVPKTTISTPSPSSTTSSSSSTTVESCSVTFTGQPDDDDDAAVIERRAGSKPIDRIGSCVFPNQARAIQPGSLSFGKFTGLQQYPKGNSGRDKLIYDTADKWYIVKRGGKYFYDLAFPLYAWVSA